MNRPVVSKTSIHVFLLKKKSDSCVMAVQYVGAPTLLLISTGAMEGKQDEW